MPASARLSYEPVHADALGTLHALATDPHVLRFLLDGAVVPREWTAARIAESETLFARLGVGLWLVRDVASEETVGFCGFLELGADGPELVYAILEPFTGRGLATEMARAAIAHARDHAGFREIVAGVDAVNTASVKVLERLGFARVATTQGHFGELWRYRLGPVPAAFR